MRFAAALASCFVLSVSPVAASDNDLIDRYFNALNMPEVFEILREEGIESALEIAERDEGISVSPAWTSRVSAIYAVDKMDAAFRLGMGEVSNLEASTEALEFFESELGRRIVAIELDARRALGEDGIEDAMRDRAEAMLEEQPERIQKYADFIRVNDLVDSNVMGALNANLAFYQGLGTNPLFSGMDEQSMLARVYGQEAEIREDMVDWTMNFSVLAYSILLDEELDAYIDASDSRPGQVLNTALFAGFDQVFELQSFELGRAMAEFMEGDDT
ncbi:hypothetical protein [uncultured Litoreibacter sp.]|uniref:hypothetical protein n=1 Tax=uncultured Litoreibacter sp. TaxID=1392394 RepID=UPI00261FE3A9|nr:hypothetical protein [uncultured Litoreibacter sp.]